MEGTVPGSAGWYTTLGCAGDSNTMVYMFALKPSRTLGPDPGFWHFECTGPVVQVLNASVEITSSLIIA